MAYYINEYIHGVGRTLIVFSNRNDAQSYYDSLTAVEDYDEQNYIALEEHSHHNFEATN